MEVLSERLRNMSESATLAMTRKSRELTSKGYDVINLSIGEPDFDTPDFIKKAAIKAINDNHTHYPPVAGFQELRQVVVNKLKRDNDLEYKAEQIIISAGAKHSIANAMLSIIGPGDEVIVPTPYWVSYKEIIKLAQGIPVFIETSLENDFKITPEQLEQAINPRTKAIIYSSPCNPSGSVYTRQELKGLAEVLTNYKNVFIISDEIYELISFVGKHESIAQFNCLKDQVIIINGVSKGFAMTGWRIGYMAAPKVVAQACDKLQGQITSGVCTISQYAAIEALKADPYERPEITEMIKIFRERRNFVLDLLKDVPGIKTNMPQGAFYVFMNVQNLYGKKFGGYSINNANDLALYLLEHAHVALVPGDAFGNPDCLRLSYATSKDLLKEAVKRIQQALK